MLACHERATCHCDRIYESRVGARSALGNIALMPGVTRSIGLFVLAAIAEIGGGYLMWRWLRDGRSVFIGLAGAALLVIYGIIPTLQPSTFGRTYAAYGGIFVVGSLLWGWWADGNRPDAPDAFGALLCLIGIAVIMYWPRT
jgi:small multidrug resistance family-3 protein